MCRKDKIKLLDALNPETQTCVIPARDARAPHLLGRFALFALFAGTFNLCNLQAAGGVPYGFRSGLTFESHEATSTTEQLSISRISRR